MRYPRVATSKKREINELNFKFANYISPYYENMCAGFFPSTSRETMKDISATVMGLDA